MNNFLWFVVDSQTMTRTITSLQLKCYYKRLENAKANRLIKQDYSANNAKEA